MGQITIGLLQVDCSNRAVQYHQLRRASENTEL